MSLEIILPDRRVRATPPRVGARMLLGLLDAVAREREAVAVVPPGPGHEVALQALLLGKGGVAAARPVCAAAAAAEGLGVLVGVGRSRPRWWWW